MSYLPSQSCDVCPPHYQIARGSHEGRLHLAMMMMMMMMVLLATMIQIVMIMTIIILVIRVTLIVGLPPRLTSF